MDEQILNNILSMEQLLNRISQLHQTPANNRTIEEIGLLVFLKRQVKNKALENKALALPPLRPLTLPAMDELQARADVLNAQGSAEDALGDVILDLLEIDNHYWGTHPCPTCAPISRLLNRPYGCYAEAERRRDTNE